MQLPFQNQTSVPTKSSTVKVHTNVILPPSLAMITPLNFTNFLSNSQRYMDYVKHWNELW